jgi:hypothetical protein
MRVLCTKAFQFNLSLNSRQKDCVSEQYTHAQAVSCVEIQRKK